MPDPTPGRAPAARSQTPDGRIIWLGLAMTVSGAFIGASSPIFAKVIYGAGGSLMGALSGRFLVGAAVVWTYLFLRGARPRFGRHALTVILMGGLGNAGQSLAYFAALTRLPASLAGLLISTTPVYVTILARIVYGEPISPLKLAALAGALGGVAMILGFSTQAVDPVGVALAATTGMIFALYIMVGRRLLLDISPLDLASGVLPAAGITFLALGLLTRSIVLPATTVGLAALLALGAIPTVLANVAYMSGMRLLGASRTALAGISEPVFVVLLSAAILGERLSPTQLLGGAVVLTCVLILRWVR